jgi:hypothetical protein
MMGFHPMEQYSLTLCFLSPSVQLRFLSGAPSCFLRGALLLSLLPIFFLIPLVPASISLPLQRRQYPFHFQSLAAAGIPSLPWPNRLT